MAHLWIQESQGWRAEQLTARVFELARLEASAGGLVARDAAEPVTRTTASLARSEVGGAPAWALIAPPHSRVRVNGEAPLAGLCVLADRDEIVIASGVRYFFSTETLAQVDPFPGSEQGQAVFCGRCRDRITRGALAVRCGGCGIWYHQDADLPCWSYSENCAFCGRATALDAGFQWTPEDEGR